MASYGLQVTDFEHRDMERTEGKMRLSYVFKAVPVWFHYSELPEGDDKFSHIHNFRKTKQNSKPKPAPESPRPGAADCRGKIIKSALAGLGS